MRISVIIPALDERDVIGAAVDRARMNERCEPSEIIVVDGGSVDGTPAVAEARGACVVASPPGRGRQMNTGAAVATGDVLLFLHADTALPVGYAGHVGHVLARRGVAAGAFQLRIDAPNHALRLIEAAVNRRSRWLGMPYGDQAIFMPATTFRAVGGYPEAEAMEDFAIIRRLRRLGRISIAPTHVTTSPRRWLACGVWRTTLLNQVCVTAWLAGVSGHRIARWRGAACPSGGTTHAAVPHKYPGSTTPNADVV